MVSHLAMARDSVISALLPEGGQEFVTSNCSGRSCRTRAKLTIKCESRLLGRPSYASSPGQSAPSNRKVASKQSPRKFVDSCWNYVVPSWPCSLAGRQPRGVATITLRKWRRSCNYRCSPQEAVATMAILFLFDCLALEETRDITSSTAAGPDSQCRH